MHDLGDAEQVFLLPDQDLHAGGGRAVEAEEVVAFLEGIADRRDFVEKDGCAVVVLDDRDPGELGRELRLVVGPQRDVAANGAQRAGLKVERACADQPDHIGDGQVEALKDLRLGLDMHFALVQAPDLEPRKLRPGQQFLAEALGEGLEGQGIGVAVEVQVERRKVLLVRLDHRPLDGGWKLRNAIDPQADVVEQLLQVLSSGPAHGHE